ncbi:MAG: hypothetical protein LBI17_01155 [Rickettsiales bacterium]|jgi:hypothetical protein|nr:hypothetical protein [Rickettsiales bacterium]
MRRFASFSCFALLAAAVFAGEAFSRPGSGAGKIRSAAGSAGSSRIIRSASSGGGSGKRAASSAPVAGRGSDGTPSKVAGKLSKSDKDAGDASAGPVPSGAESCLGSRIAGLLENECSYLVPEEIAGSLDLEKKPFYCVFSYKEGGSGDSASGYFLRAAYNMSEDQLGSEGAARMVRDTENIAMYKYYDYVLAQIEAGTLHESMVMDSLANEALSGSVATTGLDNAKKTSIKKKHVEQVSIPLSLSSVDLDRCRRASKDAFVDQCKMMGNMAAKKLVKDSCQEYEEILQVVASDRKSRAVASASQIRQALLKRIMASTAEEKMLSDLKQELADQMTATAQASRDFALAEPKSKRQEAALALSPMVAEYAEMKEGSAKNRSKKEIDALQAEICKYDRQIVAIDLEYKAPDCLAKCKDGLATGAEPAACLASEPDDDASSPPQCVKTGTTLTSLTDSVLEIRYGTDGNTDGSYVAKSLSANDYTCKKDIFNDSSSDDTAKKCWHLSASTTDTATTEWQVLVEKDADFTISCDDATKMLKAAKKEETTAPAE